MGKKGNVLYPLKFNSKYIVTHPDYESGLKDILERSGRESDFRNKYKNRLRFLEERKKNCVLRSKWFENLKQADQISAMIFDKSEKNIRILFSFIEYEERQYAILLYAFEEKDRMSKSKTSYNTGIPIAEKRLKEVMEDEGH